MKIQQYEITHVGRVRSENQDSIYVMADQGTYLVADGMGGEKAGREASEQVVETVKRTAGEFFSNGHATTPEAIVEMADKALTQANADVHEISVREPDKKGLGSTGSLLFLHKGMYFAAQVGDSRIYLVRNGNVKQITRDHSIVWELYESGVLTREQMETHPERNLLTQCIGGEKPVSVEVFQGRVQPGDLYLLCSDGLTGYAGEERVIKMILDPMYTVEERCQRMLQAAMEGGGGDNISIIVAQVDALDPEDDWMPAEDEEQKKIGAVAQIEMISADQPIAKKSSSKVLVYAGIAWTVFAVVVFLLALLMKSRDREVTFVLEGLESTENVVVSMTDGEGELIEDPDYSIEENRVVVDVARKEAATVKLSSPGYWPQYIYVSEEPREKGAETPVTLQKAAQLTLALPAGDISAIRIVNEAAGNEVYHFPNENDTEPQTEFEIQPGANHRVTADHTEGFIFEKDISIGSGETGSVAVEF